VDFAGVAIGAVDFATEQAASSRVLARQSMSKR
jgi:hypothetical protein